MRRFQTLILISNTSNWYLQETIESGRLEYKSLTLHWEAIKLQFANWLGEQMSWAFNSRPLLLIELKFLNRDHMISHGLYWLEKLFDWFYLCLEVMCNSPTFQTPSQELRTILLNFIIRIFTDLIVKIIRFVLYLFYNELLFLGLIMILSALSFIY